VQLLIYAMTSIIKVEHEEENEIIAKIGNPRGLNNARRVLFQEQASIRARGGRIRVRRERGANAQQWGHALTTKHPQPTTTGESSNKETTKTIDRMAYGMFMSVAGEYQRKARHIFPLEKIRLIKGDSVMDLAVSEPVFEVDVFFKQDGTQSPWCKIDFEHRALKDELKKLGIDSGEFDMILPISSLPFDPKEYFLAGKSMLPAQKKLRDYLYETEWNRQVNLQEVEDVFFKDNTKEV